jgi:hypothetical protein
VLVIGLVVLYVIASVLVALRVNRYVCNHPRRRMRWTLVGLATMVGVLTAWSWRNPGRMLSSMAGGGDIAAVKTKTGAVFEFGAYPDAAKLKELKAAGVTTVISLQDPNVVVESQGIHEESEAATTIGLKMVEAPMVPWFSENSESLAKIRQIALTGSGVYYVHCGLGRDRVNIVKRLIESLGATAVATNDLHQALGFEGRTWNMQRGSLISLDPGVWLIPYPEKEEMMGCIFEGRPGRVVVLLDSTKAPQDSLLRDVHRLFPSYGVPFVVMSPSRPAEAASVVREMKRPVTVIAYRTPWSTGRQKDDAPAVSLANAYKPDSSWRITSAPPTAKRKAYVETGGKEKAC